VLLLCGLGRACVFYCNWMYAKSKAKRLLFEAGIESAGRLAVFFLSAKGCVLSCVFFRAVWSFKLSRVVFQAVPLSAFPTTRDGVID